MDHPPLAASLRDFVLGLSDAVLVLGAGRQVLLANAAARALLSIAADAPPPRQPWLLPQVVGDRAAARVQALLAVLARDAELPAPLPLMLENGRHLKISAHRLELDQWLLRLAAATPSAAPAPPATASGPGARCSASSGIRLFP